MLPQDQGLGQSDAQWMLRVLFKDAPLPLYRFKETKATEKKLYYSGRQRPAPRLPPARRLCPAALMTTLGPTGRRRAPCLSAPLQWRWATRGTVPKWPRCGRGARVAQRGALGNDLQVPPSVKRLRAGKRSHYLTHTIEMRSCVMSDVGGTAEIKTSSIDRQNENGFILQ